MPVAYGEKKRLGAEIKEQRENGRMKLREVAKKCSISPAALSDIENGINFPKEETFLQLISVLGFSNKENMCDLYAELKKTTPPDITDYLVNNRAVVHEVRQLIASKGT